MDRTTSYSASELPEFLAAISSTADPERALSNGIGRIAETFDAEVVAVVEAKTVVASIGYRPDDTGADLLAFAAGRSSSIAIAGFGPVAALRIELGSSRSSLIIARAAEPLSNVERAHAEAMARILALAMKLVDKLDENEGLLERQQRLLDQHLAHQATQEAVLRVQHLIIQRQPVGTTLQAITAELVGLTQADIVGIVLDRQPASTHRLVAIGSPAGRSLLDVCSEDVLLEVGKQAISETGGTTAVTIETSTGDAIDGVAVASGVFDDGRLVGSLFLLSVDRTHGDDHLDTAPLDTFASQASIAVADASTVSELEHAFHDHLTGLPNRALFQDRFEHALDLGRRYGTITALLFLDLDRFKDVNDTLGHAAGDALLRKVGAALQNGGRTYDSVARIGGDEFAILLEDATPEKAEAVARRLAERLRTVINPAGGARAPGVSIGIALSSSDCDTTDELLRRADIAMYSVKSSGRAGVATYNAAMGQTRRDRRAQTDALRAALVGDDFVVHYQPIIDLQRRQISGVEALVRWNDPDRGFVGPASFIESAEQSGMIIPIGRRVLEIACDQAATWRRTIPSAADLNISVNMSVRQLEDDGMQRAVSDVLESTGLEPAALTLEVTESIFVKNAENAGAQLRALKRLGTSLAIDDFGTGFSSLSYVDSYPFHVLKIDREFVKGLGTPRNGGAVVRTMLGLAEHLRMGAVAEGIESPVELAQLRALRCSHGQGFLFSRPVEAGGLEELLLSGISTVGGIAYRAVTS